VSTKAIRRVLEGALDHPNSGDDVRAALAEVEAIEKAVGDVVTTLNTPFKLPHSEWQKTCAFLRAMAEEKP